MAKMRTMRHEVYSNPVLGANPALQLIFLALMNFSDDSGYFQNNPILIRGAMFPYWTDIGPIIEAVAQLEAAGFLETRIHPKKGPIGRILDWEAWQKVDNRAKSLLEEPFASAPAILAIPVEPTRVEEISHDDPPDSREDSRGLASGREELPRKGIGIGREVEGEGEATGSLASESAAPTAPPVEPDPKPSKAEEEFKAIYNEAARKYGFKVCMEMGKTRKAALRERLKEKIGDRPWRDCLPVALESFGGQAWCTGGGERKWRLDPDFILRPESVVRGLEDADASKARRPAGDANVSMTAAEVAVDAEEIARLQRDDLIAAFGIDTVEAMEREELQAEEA
jgi:hypothetical protein